MYTEFGSRVNDSFLLFMNTTDLPLMVRQAHHER